MVKDKFSKHRIFLIYAGLVLVTFIAFEQVRTCQFTDSDDTDYVTENEHVLAGITPHSIVWAFTTPHGGTSYWHPLTWISHMLDCELFGLKPAWHHLVNLLFHIANTLLLFWVLKNMTGALWPSAFVAAAFAVHPLHVESVAWVAERKDVLSGFFWILTMAAYIRYAKRGGIARYMVVVLVFSLALMSKPMVVTLPCVLLLLDYWPLNRFGQLPVKRLIAEKIPLFVLVAIVSIVTFIAQKDIGAMEKLPAGFRISNAIVSYVSYLGKMIYPANLAVLYPLKPGGFALWQPVGAFLLLAVISAGVFFAARRRPGLNSVLIGWLWYLGTLVPVIGLVQVGNQAMADRYMYLPAIGFFIMIAWTAAEIFRKVRHGKAVLVVSACIAIITMVICTRKQVRYWQNDITLFGHAVEVTENNFEMHNSYGIALNSQDKTAEAISHFTEALRIKPDYVLAINNLGVALQKQGKIDQAVAQWQKVIQLNPDYAEAHFNLGMVQARQGNTAQAIEIWQRVLELEPNHADTHFNLGLAMVRAGRNDDAVKHLSEALRLRPQWLQANYSLAGVYRLKGRLDLVVKHCEEALRLNPDYLPARIHLAYTLVELGQLQAGIEQYKKILEIDPDNARVRDSLAAAYTKQ